EVQEAVMRVLDFWLSLGVDGLRLDAVPYLYEREGTNCENLPETHVFLKQLRRHVDQRYRNRMLLAEANQWPEDAVAYFGSGDECHMSFHFPLMPRLFMGIGMEENIYLGDRNGVRTPMQWSSDRNAGFSRTNPQRLYLPVVIDPEYHYETVNVEAQHNNPHSLLWWMRRLLALRRRYRAFGR